MARKSNNLVDYKRISQNLNLIITETGISKSELGKRIGITSSTTVSKRFKGKGWTLEEMAACSKLVGRTVEDIFFSRLSTNVNK